MFKFHARSIAMSTVSAVGGWHGFWQLVKAFLRFPLLHAFLPSLLYIFPREKQLGIMGGGKEEEAVAVYFEAFTCVLVV